jgi:glycosyltransferase involved in cell wall biosynthesis
MKLVIQIPCYNEETTLPVTLADIPRTIPGVDEVEILVIDDGSDDRTAEVAREHNVDHVIRLTNRKGLAQAFKTGLDASLKRGADIIVNTDADNQYKGSEIPKLIQPILSGMADIVVGCRPIDNIRHFSIAKKALQKFGSWVVRGLSGTTIPDVTSGFRAYSRDAALRLNVISEFTYTLETVIQAGKKSMAIAHLPVATNENLRESRLAPTAASYVKRSVGTIVRIYAMYEPLKIFTYIGVVIGLGGLALIARFLYFYFTGGGRGHIQSLLVASILVLVGFQVVMFGLMADLIGANRRLLEDSLRRVRWLELEVGQRDD